MADINLLELVHPEGKPTLIESETAFFDALVPSIAPEAYFHIFFKPIVFDFDVVATIGRPLPQTWKRFFEIQNGAHLFSDALSLYGLHRPGQLLNRSGGLDARLPFNLARESRRYRAIPVDAGLVIGSYGFDGSPVCLSFEDESISVFEGQSGNWIASWASPLDWLTDEIARLKLLFDSQGKCLVSRAETVPNSKRSAQ